MGEGVDLSKLRSLSEEPPGSVMGCIRIAWPEIKAALDRHVTLKTVHERLTEAGISISYRRLSFYVGRLRREEASNKTAAPKREKAVPDNPVQPSATDDAPARDRDPLSNFRERTVNRPGFDFRPGPPDEDELI